MEGVGIRNRSKSSVRTMRTMIAAKRIASPHCRSWLLGVGGWPLDVRRCPARRRAESLRLPCFAGLVVSLRAKTLGVQLVGAYS